jgi:hypothetical protein
MVLTTPNAPIPITALFDTGSNVIILDHKWVCNYSIFQVQWQQQFTVIDFAGQPENGTGRAFTPHL